MIEKQLWHPVVACTELRDAPLGLELLGESVVLWREPGHHLVAGLARGEDLHAVIGEDHRQALRARIDTEKSGAFHVMRPNGGLAIHRGRGCRKN